MKLELDQIWTRNYGDAGYPDIKVKVKIVHIDDSAVHSQVVESNHPERIVGSVYRLLGTADQAYDFHLNHGWRPANEDLQCRLCANFYSYVESNRSDGAYICYNCRAN